MVYYQHGYSDIMVCSDNYRIWGFAGALQAPASMFPPSSARTLRESKRGLSHAAFTPLVHYIHSVYWLGRASRTPLGVFPYAPWWAKTWLGLSALATPMSDVNGIWGFARALGAPTCILDSHTPGKAKAGL